MALRKIAELYGFCENMPITAKITRVDGNCLEAMMAESQLKLYNKWIKFLLDQANYIRCIPARNNKGVKRNKVPK
jgi:hypothetical protein